MNDDKCGAFVEENKKKYIVKYKGKKAVSRIPFPFSFLDGRAGRQLLRAYRTAQKCRTPAREREKRKSKIMRAREQSGKEKKCLARDQGVGNGQEGMPFDNNFFSKIPGSLCLSRAWNNGLLMKPQQRIERHTHTQHRQTDIGGNEWEPKCPKSTTRTPPARTQNR